MCTAARPEPCEVATSWSWLSRVRRSFCASRCASAASIASVAESISSLRLLTRSASSDTHVMHERERERERAAERQRGAEGTQAYASRRWWARWPPGRGSRRARWARARGAPTARAAARRGTWPRGSPPRPPRCASASASPNASATAASRPPLYIAHCTLHTTQLYSSDPIRSDPIRYDPIWYDTIRVSEERPRSNACN